MLCSWVHNVYHINTTLIQLLKQDLTASKLVKLEGALRPDMLNPQKELVYYLLLRKIPSISII